MNIAIHGIGDSEPDYYKRWDINGALICTPSEVMGFYYEDILDDDKISIVAKLAAKAAASYYAPGLAGLVDKPVDYLEDIFVFFLSAEARRQIEGRFTATLQRAFQQTKQVRVFAHSLGSIIAYWYFMNHPDYLRVELVTMGSPLGSRLLGGLVNWWMKRLVKPSVMTRPGKSPVWRWVNICSVLDVLSGFIYDLGCKKENQIRAEFSRKILHREVDEYVWLYRDTFLIEPDLAA